MAIENQERDVSGSFAAAVRQRLRLADAALQAARAEDDVDALMLAEAEWEDVTHLARSHGMRLDADAGTTDSGGPITGEAAAQ
ncbi:hypothetical protein ACIBO2_57070 [Nonomuraea sp. NPDC050022]|uniref:hypothetical protein n=1 Tax=unclassified Nonomuraea TaxID=2593643 RepID=UPI0033ED3508